MNPNKENLVVKLISILAIGLGIYYLLMKRSNIIWILGAISYVVSGIGMLKLKVWAKNLFIFMMIISLYQFFMGLIAVINLAFSFKYYITAFVILSLYTLGYFVLPILFIVFLNKQSVKKNFS